MSQTALRNPTNTAESRLGAVTTPRPHKIGKGFTAHHFSEDMFDGRMDPLLMVDHFTMTESTFGPHLHAGISAVTFIFEDATGDFINRDTLGQNVALKPGDLYWFAAASGAVHDERPGSNGARTHALQIFVNLPERLKTEPARSIYVPARSMPILQGPGYRVRLALGRSGEVKGASGTPQEMTILDGRLDAGEFEHQLPAYHSAWVYAVSGELVVDVGHERVAVSSGKATTIQSVGVGSTVKLSGTKEAHFVLMAATPIRERFVKHGSLVMSSEADVRKILDDYAAGHFGTIAG